MSRNAPIIIECSNCGRDVNDGTVGNRLHKRFCDACGRTYTKAIDEFVKYSYVYGLDFSFVGKGDENGKSTVPQRLDIIKERFLEEHLSKHDNNNIVKTQEI